MLRFSPKGYVKVRDGAEERSVAAGHQIEKGNGNIHKNKTEAQVKRKGRDA